MGGVLCDLWRAVCVKEGLCVRAVVRVAGKVW